MPDPLDLAVGRFIFADGSRWGTGFLVSNGAVITAGHVADADYGGQGPAAIEFNVPPSDPVTGEIVPSLDIDQYPIDVENITLHYGEYGDDWAVLGMLPNAITGLSAFEAQGDFYRMYSAPSLDDISDVQVTGYGNNVSLPPETNQVQQTHIDSFVGETYLSSTRIYLEYFADTAFNSSGSPVIAPESGVALGTHTTGGCDPPSTGNMGTSFKHADFEAAIQVFPGPDVVYIDAGHPFTPKDGTVYRPFATLADGIAEASPAGILSVVAGTYVEDVAVDKPLTLHLPVGAVAVGGTIETELGGALTIGEDADFAATDMVVGDEGIGSVTQTGGMVAVTNNMVIGGSAGAEGTYRLLGGYLSVFGGLSGGVGTSYFYLDGGVLEVAGLITNLDQFVVGQASGSNSTFSVAGTDEINTAELIVGDAGSGSITQSGGTVTVDSHLLMGALADSEGTYRLSGGSLDVGGSISGGVGASHLYLDGGELTVAGDIMNLTEISIAEAAGSFAALTITDSQYVSVADLIVGDEGTGTLTQTGPGSNVAISNGLVLGGSAGSGGTCRLVNGALAVQGTVMGGPGTSRLIVDSNDFSVDGSILNLDELTIGEAASANVALTIADGDSTQEYNMIVGLAGTAVVTQTGGTNIVENALYIGVECSANAAYHLQGGTLQVNTIHIGLCGYGVFNWSNGQLDPPGGWLTVHVWPGGEFDDNGQPFDGEVIYHDPFDDCNGNGIPDQCDLSCDAPAGECNLPGCGQSQDFNRNGIPDECESAGWRLRADAGPPARRDHATAYDSVRAVTVLFGGRHQGSEYGNDTWEWDGTSWIEVTPPDPENSPPGRQQAAMTYDTGRGVTVLFGGKDASTWKGDTWEWNGSTWTMMHPGDPNGNNAPSPRTAPRMVFDQSRGTIVLFGGYDGGGPSGMYSDLWEWDGNGWTELPSNSGPGGREMHGMAYDTARAKVVVFGGEQGNSQRWRDTWLWDSHDDTWEQGPLGPSKRSNMAMTFDTARKVTLLFGGEDGSIFSGDTWAFDGASWVPLETPVHPSNRTKPFMAYDSARQVCVLFGGCTDTKGLSQETWEFGVSVQGDFDHDGDVDINDFNAFADCILGPREPYGEGCEIVDFDSDEDVDLADFARFQAIFTGSQP